MITSATQGPAARFRFAPILTATVVTVLLLLLLGKAAHVLLLLFGAIIISLGLQAMADVFVRRVHVSKRFALFMAIILTFGVLIGLLVLLVPPVVEQTQALVHVLPDYISGWEAKIDAQAAKLPGLADFWKPGQHRVLLALYDQLSSQFSDILPRVLGFVELAISIFSLIIMSIYLSLYPGLYREWLIALFPPVHRDLVRDVLSELGVELRNFIVAQLTTMSILGALTALGLWALGVPYWLTFGLFTGVVSIVPFFGTLLSTTLPAVFVLNGATWHGITPGSHAILVVLLGVVVHLIEGNLLMPLITQHKMNLPPVLTIVAVLIVGNFLGTGGLLVAVPLLVVVMVVVRRILVNRLYEGQGFRRTARDRTLVLRVPVPEGGIITTDLLGADLVGLAEAAALHRVRPVVVGAR